MNEFGQGIRKPTCAHVMYRQDGIRSTQRPAAVDHLLRTAFDFRVASLHRVEIEVFLIGARVHTGGGAAAEPDQHAGAAELNHQSAFRERRLGRVDRSNAADAPGDHDRLVIAADLLPHAALVGTEIAGQIGTPEFVVERGTPDRALEHDLQR